MKQTWEMTKKPSFWTNFGPFRPNFGPQIFLWILPVLDVDIIASNHCMQFQGKLKNQNMRKWKKKTSFGHDFGPMAQIRTVRKFFIFKNLTWLVIRYHSQLSSCTISEKLMIQSSEKLVMGSWQMDKQTMRVIS